MTPDLDMCKICEILRWRNDENAAGMNYILDLFTLAPYSSYRIIEMIHFLWPWNLMNRFTPAPKIKSFLPLNSWRKDSVAMVTWWDVLRLSMYMMPPWAQFLIMDFCRNKGKRRNFKNAWSVTASTIFSLEFLLVFE